MDLRKKPVEIYQNNHLNTMPNGMLRGIADQDLINAHLQYYGNFYTKNFPKNWSSQWKMK